MNVNTIDIPNKIAQNVWSSQIATFQSQFVNITTTNGTRGTSLITDECIIHVMFKVYSSSLDFTYVRHFLCFYFALITSVLHHM